MNNNFVRELEDNKIKFICNEKMKNHTTFKIGGNADYFITPSNLNECKISIVLCQKYNIEYEIVGKGSNLLVNDLGYRGAIICAYPNMSDISLLNESTLICSAGTNLSAVCKFALENSLSGIEFAYGIPGTIGGAVTMNAGAYGGEMKDIVSSCEYVDEKGKINSLNADELDFKYRHSLFSDRKCMITSVTINLKNGNSKEIKEKMDELLLRRKSKQPLEFPSAGSTFKRPEGSYASLLIDECGLKGKSVGDAQVSEKHAGFVINRGNASCKDVLILMDYIINKVYKDTGYKLEAEIKVI